MLIFSNVFSLSKSNEYSLLDVVFDYCKNNLIINTICFALVEFANGFEYKLLDDATFCVAFSMKYMVIAVIIALLLKFINSIIKINLKIEKKRR